MYLGRIIEFNFQFSWVVNYIGTYFVVHLGVSALQKFELDHKWCFNYNNFKSKREQHYSNYLGKARKNAKYHFIRVP